MIWDEDQDVKEYRPRKRKLQELTKETNFDGYPLPPEAPGMPYGLEKGLFGGIGMGGVQMPTSEILDFSEGVDSY